MTYEMYDDFTNMRDVCITLTLKCPLSVSAGKIEEQEFTAAIMDAPVLEFRRSLP